MAKKPSFASRMTKTLSTINTPTFRTGFSKVDLWVGVSNYAMNRLWSGRFDRAMLFGRNYVFYGESGSGKSLMAAIAAGNAQREHGAYVIWIDVEHATDDDAGEKWLQRAGVDTGEENFAYTSAATLEEIKTIIAKTSVDYRAQVNAGETDLPPVVIVVDSWAAAITDSQWEKTGGKDAGKVVGDMGQKAKQTGDVILATTHLCAGLPMMVIGVQHIMDNQDGYGRKHKTTGGNKMIYYASGCMMLSKKELRLEDVDNAEVKQHYAELEKGMLADVKKAAGGDKRHVGITATMEILKSRVSKPFDKVEIQIPYGKGLDPYSGLFDLLMQEGQIIKGSPGWFEYKTPEGLVKFQKSKFEDHAHRLMELSDIDIGGTEELEAVPESIDDEVPVEG
jgi:recombination protein RecA